MAIQDNDEFLLNRKGKTFKAKAKDIDDYNQTTDKTAKDGELFVVNHDASVKVKKFSANQGANSSITFKDGVTINNNGQVILDADWFEDNGYNANNGRLMVSDGNNTRKAFSANQADESTIEFTNAKVTKSGTTVKVEIQNGGDATVDWDDIDNKPKCFDPCKHKHDWDALNDPPWEDFPVCDDVLEWDKSNECWKINYNKLKKALGI